MDWHAWLSGARLEPVLVYEYALVFARNELEPDDVVFFDHEFLHSMGISVAKHRLEILKLAWRERDRRSRARPAALARLLLGRVARYVRSLVRRDEDGSTALVLVPSQQQQHDAFGRSPCGGVSMHKQQRRGGKALRRAKSEPKGPTPRFSVGGRAAAAVHAVGDVEGGDGDEMVRWDRLFQDLKPN
ncbi:hypothetical protein BDA96_06G260200 [Sorghum bicolor]|jgi:hypothetical protein|uniref:SAM domain-containing protein n=2 Tax=Sorghum bicolor TaxID=4558 RepID=A0A921QU74_SORBI|nr:uncharacterized protein LOC8068472 [Sorghum bicolor]EES11537.1 hypothetical protein SORBI_3006G237800 [Sorghum bicolor]KAG0527748.1 hypothetical protein BDA96_06G260200 [Sorghum bicolor]|eukprot:XP_002447209.1 uncharacterized protein LOC8068472 [Sorghum bicolor]